jgi:hypothetical protein
MTTNNNNKQQEKQKKQANISGFCLLQLIHCSHKPHNVINYIA